MKKIIPFLLLLISCETFISSTQKLSMYKNGFLRNTNINYSLTQPCIELVGILTNNNYLKYTHDVEMINDTIAAVIGKGDPTLTTKDGSIALVNVANPDSSFIWGGYSGKGNLIDGETVLKYSGNRFFGFAKGKSHLFSVSNPIVKIKTVTHSGHVINGAVESNGYLFGADKGGYIHVFNVSNVDVFTLVGSYIDGISSNLTGPHDIAIYGDYIVYADRDEQKIKLIRVFQNGILIPVANWSVSSFCVLPSVDLNRIKIIDNNAFGFSKNYLTKVSISNPDSVYVVSSFTQVYSPDVRATYGASVWDAKLVAAWGIGIKIINPFAMSEECGYMDNGSNFNIGSNSNFHDPDVFVSGGTTYIIMTVQNTTQIAIFKIQ